jgi:hypothetical protein
MEVHRNFQIWKKFLKVTSISPSFECMKSYQM